ncbi:MAG: DNA cytosine methyltransferase [Bacteroidetes bacterium]|nr:DNA cytosine methyltransferase [Bacteroidota bacterium]
MSTPNNKPLRKRIIVVSLFSGMDLFLLGMVKAGMQPGYAVEKNFYACLMHKGVFKHPDGTPVMEPFVIITKEEYTFKKNHRDKNGKKDMEDEVGQINGVYYRTKLIQEINGGTIRAALEKRYGKDIIIVVIGGPPCQDFTNLNSAKNTGEDSRNQLVFEFLRIVEELKPDVALMEQVPDFGPSGKFEEIYNSFLEDTFKLPYEIMDCEMCSIHYHGRQLRWRRVFQFVHKSYNTKPVFPKPELNNTVLVKDFLDIDYFVMGGYDRVMRHPNQYMLTVTSGNPTDFFKGEIKRPPTIDELLDCFDVPRGGYPIPEGIPFQQKRKAIGNGVCVSVAYALGKTVISEVLRLKPDGDGYFIPIDSSPDNPDLMLVEVPPTNPAPDGDTAVADPLDAAPATDPTPIEEEVKEETTPPTVLRNIITTDANHNKIEPPKIISSTSLEQMQFQSLNFDGLWNEFFGYPSINFHCLIHGLSGHGKSTFAIQFAKYLADYFGRVIYISGEEGFSMTFKDKFVNNGAGSEALDVADLRSYDDIIQHVPRSAYNFIFIDSLNTMKIDVNKLKELRTMFENTAWVTISQSTKGGEMRGSYEIVHDSDVAVKVTNGMAVTTKNRFKPLGSNFRVFKPNNDSQSILERYHDNPDESPGTQPSSDNGVRISNLKIQLDDALAAENFELAAKLRDEINRIEEQK